jgi:hypothetical protein
LGRGCTGQGSRPAATPRQRPAREGPTASAASRAVRRRSSGMYGTSDGWWCRPTSPPRAPVQSI